MHRRIAALSILVGATLFHVLVPSMWQGMATALGASVLYLLMHMASRRQEVERSLLDSMELAVGMAVFAVLLVEVLDERMAPVAYVMSGFMGAFLPWGAAGVGIATMTVLAALLGMGGWPWIGAFSLVFAVAAYLAFHLEVRGVRRLYERKIREFMDRIHEEARTFRLAGSSRTSETDRDDEEQERLMILSSLHAIHDNARFVLQALATSLDVDSAAFVWRGWDEGTARVVEAVGPHEVKTEPFSVKGGLFAHVFKTGMVLSLAPFRNYSTVLSHYVDAVEPGAVMVVPVLDQGHVRGALYFDRPEATPFSEEDVQLALQGARSLLDLVTTERVLESVVRSKEEMSRFFHASSLLNSALTVGQVVESGLRAVSRILSYDTAGIVAVDSGTAKVLGGDGEPMEALVGLQFEVGRSLLRMVVEGRHPLPVGGDLRDPSQVVLTPEISFGEMRSLWVVPLVSGDRVLGVLVVGARQERFFTMERRNMLSVIANQIAAALDNAFMYEKLEEMATTDGLTGLTVRRTLMERFAEMLERARRMHRPLSVLITDIDKFKSINDTYGHQVGDEVIRRVAAVLKGETRSIDLVGRYGGEEFVAVLENTDGEGARNLAERVRQAVEKLVFDSELGPFHTSISIGIATFPEHGDREEELIEKADKALYHAKRTGRNRTIHYADIAHIEEAN